MTKKTSKYDVVIVGAGAAGLMAAIQAGARGRKVLLIEHTHKIGEKIRISGGGRCNFTNLHASPQNYISENPHFMKSALAGYTQYDFIELVESHNISYHEKTLGQLFCDGSAKQIIKMLVDLCHEYCVEIKMNCHIQSVTKKECFELDSEADLIQCDSLIIASGGLAIPKIGASDFGYRVATKFGLGIIPTRPALVPLIVSDQDKEFFTTLRGLSNPSLVSHKDTQFRENILFTHKGLSGPAILQISSYLETFNSEEIIINLLPDLDLTREFRVHKNNKKTPANFLKNYLTNRLVESIATTQEYHTSITDLKNENLMMIAESIHNFRVKVAGSEGYQKAEVTVGGVNTNELSSKTMECKNVAGLYFVGEVVDVTGWLGGYNFQWAWASGFAAGKNC
jgi:predicted Rossmann fold flavoprotein